ncbi:MAG: magnesium transporter CorA family protein [Candidatus Magasanikbacteria bacterium]|jgi:magnesium transporter|nr:magnesium transporter CorA family protein [Candidatus Magasanikbacteria bacterium]
MAIKTLAQDDLTWVNIDKVDDTAMEYLKSKHTFHHLDLDDVQGESQTPKLDLYKNHLFLVVHFPHWNAETKTIVTQELNIFATDTHLITIQHTKSREMKNFFYRCMRNKSVKKDWMSSSTGYLLYRLLESLYKESRSILNNVGKDLQILEEHVFDGDPDTKLVKRLAIHRRNIMAIRRIIDPQRYLIANLSNVRRSFLSQDISLYFDDITDYLGKLWTILDTYKDTVQGLHVTVESLINQKTNKVVGTLTAISVGLLPFTVLSSMYGMNIIGLPFARDPAVVWGMFIALAMAVTIAIVVMKNRKWL